MPAKQQDPATWLDSLADRPELKQAFERGAARLLESLRNLPPETGTEDGAGFRVSITGNGGNTGNLRVTHPGPELVLSDTVPVLENAGLRVLSQAVWQLDDAVLEDFRVEAVNGSLPTDAAAADWSDALAVLLAGGAADDGLNALLLSTSLSLRQLDLLRAYAMYRAQIDQGASTDGLHAVLARNPGAAEALFELFSARFDPAGGDSQETRTEKAGAAREEFLSVLAGVSSLHDDRSLRGLLNLIEATVRTNFFQGHERISFKLRSADVDGLEEPRPLFEIGVNSPGMSGTHLRGGAVARGGIRWSDRPLDFRSEVLGLLKTQTTKNAVIVPVGSKGGFVVRGAPADRTEQRAFVEHCYREYIRGLLDITDNQKNGEITTPENVVVWDEPDPYLVVAADKGTAGFSDIANTTAAEYDFWLGDAFASGGSHGYDHKGVGITARGAWQTTSRHFRELGIDVKKDEFTAAGIGDMGGDVFGNGMLYTDRIRLKAAFNHLHIFLDPEPDAARSYAERQRLFTTPGSSWADYGKSLISEGGGVYERAAKEIPLSPQVRAMLDTDATELSGEELIRAVLRMPVDLLWNGGIGTYVKAESESHEDVRDSANDAVRVNGSELRARVVGEGGNLGFTQLGRIEYALRGGRNNTDAIDNSGGVDLSDHEVNIKIMFQAAMAAGRLELDERNRLLEEIAEDVTELVLSDNCTQSLSLSLSEREVAENPGLYRDLQAYLGEGELDEQVEFLPDAAGLEQRAADGKGHVRPELAVLLAYSKMDTYGRLLESALPGEEEFSGWLPSYFPAALQERFSDEIRGHPLSREITATLFTNRIVDLLGSAFVFRLCRETGGDTVEVARSTLQALEALGATEFSAAVSALDNIVPAERQYGLFRELREAVAGLVTEAAAADWQLPAARAETLAAELRTAVEVAGKA